MDIDNVLYICVKLDSESKVRLKSLATEVFGDEYAKLYCDHLTLAFGRQCELFNKDLIGKTVSLKSGTIAYDDRIAALVVDSEQVSEYGCRNKHPHVTMAVFDHMTRPVHSNHMLELYEYETIEFSGEDQIELSGTITAVPKRG